MTVVSSAPGQPKRVLFAWEAGSNLGHIMGLASLARALADEGIECVFAVRDLQVGQTALKGTGFAMVQAPVWPVHVHEGNEDGSGGYLDVLATLGFGDERKLGAVMEGWQSLLTLLSPDLIVAEHSPALQALARARAIPLLVFGIGFTVPPIIKGSFPPLRADRAPLVPESRLQEALAAALDSLGVPGRWPRLADALFGPDSYALSLPELDVYGAWRQQPTLKPFDALPVFVHPPDRPRVFAYFGGELPDLSNWVKALARLDVEVECYLRNAPRALSRFLRTTGAIVHDDPPPLAELLPRVSHVVCQGGAGLCQAALAAGRPIAIIPVQGEAELNFHQLNRLGVADMLPRRGDDQTFSLALKGFLADHNRIVNMIRWAPTIANREQADALSVVTARIRRMLLSAAA